MNWETYEPTQKELDAELHLMAFCGLLRPWQCEQILAQADKKKDNGTTDYHELHEVPNGR